MNDKEYDPINITASSFANEVSVKIPWDATTDDLVRALFTISVGLSYSPSSIISAMQDYVDEHSRFMTEEPGFIAEE